MKRRNTIASLSLALAAWFSGLAQAPAQTVGPVLTGINYDVPNYANSPLPRLLGSLSGIRVIDAGCGYTVAPSVTIDPSPLGVAATATAAVDPLKGGSLTITLTTPGSGYVTVPNVTLTLPAGATCNCAASAVAQMDVDPTTGLRKFINGLPGLTAAGINNLGQYIPVAVADTGTYQGSDYYEIAVVDYREQMHGDLPKAGTKLRGYVQIYPPEIDAPVKTHQLFYPTASPTATPEAITVNGRNVYAYDNPHYLGPVIVATKNVPTRIKFYNLLPKGATGDLFVPVDTTLMGAGEAGWALGGTDGLQHYFDKTRAQDPTANAGAGEGPGQYPQNRATLHLHGGFTPWISDGTPHQWTVPVGDLSSPYQKGVSSQPVPDMLATGTTVDAQGTMTFYYPNQQSGRLMFYHDHSWGITRLNVYAGEAAGYLLQDPDEETELKAAGVPVLTSPAGTFIPLVIEDKTFVWDPAGDKTSGTYLTDPLWSTVQLGSVPGDFWFPHVYMANQNPADFLTGANSLGRWDYGPWFWPPQVPNGGLVHEMPALSTVPEAFMDTPVVNGTAYPYVNVPAGKVRLRILNACNDRMLNLQLYQADPNGFTVPDPDSQVLSRYGTEVAMVPATLNPAIPFPPAWKAQVSGMIPEILDSRPGGVPDPRLRGPAFVQIGTEGGLLPGPVVHNNTPVGYEQNKRNIVVLNVSQKTLFMGPAERADIIVDFSAYAGKTVILYNDSPAPVPAGDPRLSYYTGNEDYSANNPSNNQGGAPSTLPGYGPNIRTIMQFRVAGIPAAVAPVGDEYDTTLVQDLTTTLGTLFATRNEPPPLPQPEYPEGIGHSVTNHYARIQDTSMDLPAPGHGVATISVGTGNGGAGYQVPPAVTVSAPTLPFGKPATAMATVSGGSVQAIAVIDPGYGYQTAPTVTIAPPPVGTGSSVATATAVIDQNPPGFTINVPMQPKAIHELFDPFGRMNSVLGVEIPFTSFVIQTTIPYEYIDPTTETIPAGETQIWKITHNGVDTHAIHFHLFNVQVINRVGWDGAIRAPDANELGWKDTVRMNPLEDCIVAATAKPPILPWALPNSRRPLDPSAPLNSSGQFTGIDPNNLPIVPTQANDMTDFGWEYVWHCHLLGHEENDMMRPLVMPVSASYQYVNNAYVPSVTITTSSGPVGSWNTTPVTVTISTATQPLGAPVASITYTVNGTQTTVPTNNVSFPVSTQGTTTITATSTDSAVTPHTSALASASFQIDSAAPGVYWDTPSPAPYNVTGWNKSPVSLTYTVTDAGSGVASSLPLSPITVVGPTTAAGTTVSVTAKDNAGNTAVSASPVVKIDLIAPTATWGAANLTPAAGTLVGTARWYQIATVAYTADDALSGVASATPASPALVANGTAQKASVTVVDNAGNSAAFTSPTAYNVDGIAPTFTSVQAVPAASTFGWNNANVGNITLTAADTVSGVRSILYTATVTGRTGNATATASATVTANTLPPSFTTPNINLPGATFNAGNNTVNVTYTITDGAGNVTSGTTTLIVKIDKDNPATPTISPVTRTGTTLNISGTATDALSGIPGTGSIAVSVTWAGALHNATVTSYNAATGAFTATMAGVPATSTQFTVRVTATDAAGNISQQATARQTL